MQQSPLAFHGNTNSVQQVDGIRYNNLEGAGQYLGMYWNDGMIQEIQYTTSGDSAETQAGGVRINMIPKEGGNSFRGTVFGNFTYDKWHSNNLDQRLIDRGLQSVGKIQEIWDFNPSIGGPILRDRLWFHYSLRNWGVNRTVPGSYSEIDLDRQSIDDSYINSNVLRLTWQINDKHKLGAHYDRNHKYRGHWGLASNVSEEAAAIEDMPQSYNAQRQVDGDADESAARAGGPRTLHAAVPRDLPGRTANRAGDHAQCIPQRLTLRPVLRQLRRRERTCIEVRSAAGTSSTSPA